MESSETEKFRQPGNSQNMVPVQQLKGNFSLLKELQERKASEAISPFCKEVGSLCISSNMKNKKKNFFLNQKIGASSSSHPHKQNNLKAPRL